MKRIFLILGAVLCLCALASCSHSHEKGKTIESDKTHHWYPCYDSECDAVLDKVEHTWGEGEITTKPTATKKGIKTYLCTACKAVKQEEVEYVPTSTITKEQWENAFSPQSFGNVTIAFEEIIVSDNKEYKSVYAIQASGSVIYMVCTSYEDNSQTGYMGKYQYDGLLYSFTSKEQVIEDVVPVMSGNDSMSATNVLSNYSLSLEDYFDSFTYNEETGCYEAFDLQPENVQFGFESVSVKIADGYIAKLEAKTTLTPSSYTSFSFSNYGTTTPTPPTKNANK